MQFEFPVVKLLDYRKDWAALEASRNPFATIVIAHLKTQETRHDAEERQVWKFRLIRRLYEQGYAKKDIIGLFRFIDWLMRLPEEAEMALWHEIQAYEEGEQMDYITSVERIGMKRGFQQGVQEGIQQGKQLGLQEGKQLGERKGLLEGIELGLELKFGSEGLRLMPEIYQIEEVDMLRTVHEGLKVVETVEALRRLYRPEGAA
jgi:hypothetical protein